MSTLATNLVTMVIPSTFIGAGLARTSPVAHPERYRRLLVAVVVGAAVGILSALRRGLWEIGLLRLGLWDMASAEFLGVAGGCVWLALLAFYAGGPRPDGRLTGVRWTASAVGRRSMTVCLSQTIMFFTIFVGLPALGMPVGMGEAAAVGVAVLVWLVVVGLCAFLERAGRAGSFETLLRTAVARSSFRRRLPAPTPVPALPA